MAKKRYEIEEPSARLTTFSVNPCSQSTLGSFHDSRHGSIYKSGGAAIQSINETPEICGCCNTGSAPGTLESRWRSAKNVTMKKLSEIVKGLFALVVLGALVWGLIVLMRYVLRSLFHGVNSNVSAAIAAAVITAISSVAILALQRHYDEKSQSLNALRERKAALYKGFIDQWREVFGIGVTRSETESQEAMASSAAEFAKLSSDMLCWASGPVLAEYSRLRRLPTNNPTESAKASLLYFENVLLLMRQDLGHDDKNLRAGDLLGMWVNDIDATVEEQNLSLNKGRLHRNGKPMSL